MGFGPAAHSDFGGERFGNSRDIDGYLKGMDIIEECSCPDPRERLEEFVMLRLRLREGIERAEMERLMTDIMYEVPSRLDVAGVVITPDCIRREGDCRYILRKDLLEAEAAEDNALPSPADTASN